MSQIMALSCGAGSGNTGQSSCVFEPDLLIGTILIPKNKVFTIAEITAWQATLTAAAVNNTYANRIFPIGRYLEIQDNSDARQQKTYGYGNKKTTRPSVYNWGFPMLDGAMCMHMSLLQFNERQAQFDALFIDRSNNILGRRAQVVGSTTDFGLGGLSLTEIFVDNWKPATGSEPVNYMIYFALADATELNQFFGFVPANFDIIDTVVGVQDVTIANTNVLTAGAVNITAFAGCNSQNLVQLYGSTIANTTIWTAKNHSTGAAITITSITATGIDSTKSLNFVLDTTDPDYPTTGGKIDISLASVSAVFAGVGGYYEVTNGNLNYLQLTV